MIVFRACLVVFLSLTALATECVIPWDTTKWTNGTYVITGISYDRWGNCTTSAPVTVVVSNYVAPPIPDDAVLPFVSIYTPLPGTRVRNVFPIGADLWDNVGVIRTVLYIDGKQIAESPMPKQVVWTYAASKLKKGTHAITVRSWDAAGNSGSATVNIVR